MSADEQGPQCPRCQAPLQAAGAGWACVPCGVEQAAMGWAGEWQRRFKSLDQQDESPEGLAQKVSALSQVISLLRSRALGDESETHTLAQAFVHRSNARTTLGDADSLQGALRDADAAILHWKCIQHADRSEWAHELAATHGNRGNALAGLRDSASLQQAVQAYDEAIRLLEPIQRPERPDRAHDLAAAHLNRGSALQELGDFASLQHAVQAFDVAIRVFESIQRADRPDWADDLAAAHLNRGHALRMMGDAASLQRAVQAYDQAIRLLGPIQRADRPDWANDLAAAHLIRGNALQKMGDSASLQQAVLAYDEAIRLFEPIQRADRPDWANDLAAAHMGRGIALHQMGDAASLQQAVQAYDQAIRLLGPIQRADRPDWANYLAAAHLNRGNALQKMGDSASLQQAVLAYDEAIRLLEPIQRADRPDWANDLAAARMNRGNALQAMGDSPSLQQAVRAYDVAIRLFESIQQPERPDWTIDLSSALFNRGNAIGRHGTPVAHEQAVETYTKGLGLLMGATQAHGERVGAVPLEWQVKRAKMLRMRGLTLWLLNRLGAANADWSQAWAAVLPALLRHRHVEGIEVAEQTLRLLLEGLAASGEWQRSLELAREALDRLEDRRSMYDTLDAHLQRTAAANVPRTLREQALRLAYEVEQRHLRLFGDNAWAALRKARALAGSGSVEAARGHLQAWSARHPTDWTGPAAELHVALLLERPSEARKHQQRALDLLRAELSSADEAFLRDARRNLGPMLDDLVSSGVDLELADLRAATGPAAFAHNAEVRLRASRWIGRVEELGEQLGLGSPRGAEAQTERLRAHEQAERALHEEGVRFELEQTHRERTLELDKAYREQTAMLRDGHARLELRLEAYDALLGRVLGARLARFRERVRALVAEIGPPPADEGALEAWRTRKTDRIAALVCEFANAAPEAQRRAAIDRVHARLGDHLHHLSAEEQRLLATAAELVHHPHAPPLSPHLVALGVAHAVGLLLARRVVKPTCDGLDDEQRRRLVAYAQAARNDWNPLVRLAHMLAGTDRSTHLMPMLHAVQEMLSGRHEHEKHLPVHVIALHLSRSGAAKHPEALLHAPPQAREALCEGTPPPLERFVGVRNRCAHPEGGDIPGVEAVTYCLQLALEAQVALVPLLLDALEGVPHAEEGVARGARARGWGD